jgi:hypothetical protein
VLSLVNYDDYLIWVNDNYGDVAVEYDCDKASIVNLLIYSENLILSWVCDVNSFNYDYIVNSIYNLTYEKKNINYNFGEKTQQYDSNAEFNAFNYLKLNCVLNVDTDCGCCGCL